MRPRKCLIVVSAMAFALAGCATQFAGTSPIRITGKAPAAYEPPAPVAAAAPSAAQAPPAAPVAAPAADAPKPALRAELHNDHIESMEHIQFEAAKAVIKSESFPLLHDIAEVIRQNPQIKKVSVEGHASSEGAGNINTKLASDRAKAVVDHLHATEKIELARLVSKSWGAQRPIADNTTEAGREKNRRVEFVVVHEGKKP